MDEVSVQENLDQFKKIQLIPRHLNDLTQGNTACEILGKTFPHPIFLAPIVINNCSTQMLNWRRL